MKKLLLGLAAASLCALAPLPALAGPVDEAKAAFADGQDELGVRLLRDAAQRGDVDAQYEFAWLYITGIKVPQSYKNAAMWTLKAAEQGHAGAQHAMYDNYESGRGVEKSEAKSIYWLKKSAESGRAPAQYAFANRLHHGRGVPKNIGTAIIWYKKAAAQDHSTAQEELENLKDWQAPKAAASAPAKQAIADNKEYALRQKLAQLNQEKAAVKNTIKLTSALEDKLLYHTAVNDFQKGNVEKAISVWEQLASKGHYDSQLAAGLIFMDGERIEQSISKSAAYLTAASNNTYTHSFTAEEKSKLAAVQAAFSKIYEYGNGVPKNESRSFFWMKKSAQNGLPTAMFLVGANYELGTGTEQSKEQAVFWYRKAAAHGYSGAEKQLKRLGVE